MHPITLQYNLIERMLTAFVILEFQSLSLIHQAFKPKQILFKVEYLTSRVDTHPGRLCQKFYHPLNNLVLVAAIQLLSSR